MSNQPGAHAPTPHPRRRMNGRDIAEAHRVSTPLELLFDLTFVVAIAAAAAQLHHAVAEHHLLSGMLGFMAVFAAILWAWMNFTWFASAYDTDDATYRLWTMVQMVGVLILAAGVRSAMQNDFATMTLGYSVMRVGLVAMWWRAAREHPERRTTAMRSVKGILLLQGLWLARLSLPIHWQSPSYLVLLMLELCVPVWAAKAGHTPWHAHHISERYGLFTIIVLGECVLGASAAVGGAIEASGWSLDAALVGLGSAGLILALWWVYFLVPWADTLHHQRKRAFRWGYGHLPIFASLAALGAFLGVVADQLKPAAAGAHAVSPVLAIGLVAAATAIYLTSVWALSWLVTGYRGPMIGPWLFGSAWLVGVVLAVTAGLPLPWALPLITLAPATVIAVAERDRRARRGMHAGHAGAH